MLGSDPEFSCASTEGCNTLMYTNESLICQDPATLSKQRSQAAFDCSSLSSVCAASVHPLGTHRAATAVTSVLARSHVTVERSRRHSSAERVQDLGDLAVGLLAWESQWGWTPVNQEPSASGEPLPTSGIWRQHADALMRYPPGRRGRDMPSANSASLPCSISIHARASIKL